MRHMPAEPAARCRFLPPWSREAVSQRERSSHHPQAAAARADAGQIYDGSAGAAGRPGLTSCSRRRQEQPPLPEQTPRHAAPAAPSRQRSRTLCGFCTTCAPTHPRRCRTAASSEQLAGFDSAGVLARGASGPGGGPAPQESTALPSLPAPATSPRPAPSQHSPATSGTNITRQS